MSLDSIFVLRSIFVVVITTAVSVMVALYLIDASNVQYRAVASMLVSPSSDTLDEGDQLYALDTLTRPTVMATFVEVMNSAYVLDAAMSQEASIVTPDGIELSATAAPSANVIDVAVIAPSADDAAAIANGSVDAGLAFLEERYGTLIRFERLDAATPPETPHSPQPVRDVSLAVALGLVVGTFVVMLMASVAYRRSREIALTRHEHAFDPRV